MAIRKRRFSDVCRGPSKRPRAQQMEIDTILAKATEGLGLYYDVGKELGSGQFGIIRHCTNKQTGESFACKSIAKARLTSRQEVDDVRSEVEIMSHLSGHSNIVRLIDVFEDKEYVHIVMELCLGGELFDRIVQRKSYPESEAALLIKSLVEVVKHCHDKGIIHRDLKPENILLTTTSPSSPIKLADFGLALRFAPGQRFSGMAGSAYYVAPEVLNGNYSEEVDMWSVGVIMYVLLSGVPPFWGETEQQIYDAINNTRIDFLSEPWSQISNAAKDLIRGLLSVNATTRLTPVQVLMHPWILHHTSHRAQSQGNRMMRPQSLQATRKGFKTKEPIAEVALQDASRSGLSNIEPPEEVVPALKDVWIPQTIYFAHSFSTIDSGYLVSTQPGHLQASLCSIAHEGLGVTTEGLSATFEEVVNTLPPSVPTHQGLNIPPVPYPTVHSTFVLSSLPSLSSLSTSLITSFA